mmetsp:Transcript_21652/g.60179  ORF Transcript_21652/g.60179 Transcript_21652/m.60179 type:complete len:819 (+) Transcript_21652:226-2682(+)
MWMWARRSCSRLVAVPHGLMRWLCAQQPDTHPHHPRMVLSALLPFTTRCDMQRNHYLSTWESMYGLKKHSSSLAVAYKPDDSGAAGPKEGPGLPVSGPSEALCIPPDNSYFAATPSGSMEGFPDIPEKASQVLEPEAAVAMDEAPKPVISLSAQQESRGVAEEAAPKMARKKHRCLPATIVNHVLCREASSVTEVLAVVWAQSHCPSFVHINIGASLFRLSTLCNQGSPREQSQMKAEVINHKAFQGLITLIDENLQDMTPWSVTTSLWSFVKLGYTPKIPMLIDRMAVQAIFSPSHRELQTARTLWAISSLGCYPGREVMSGIEHRICTLIQDQADTDKQDDPGSHSGICMFLTALSRMEQHQISDKTKQALLEGLSRIVHTLDARGTVTALFGIWKLKLDPDEALWQKLNSTVDKNLDNLTSQGVAALLLIHTAQPASGRSPHILEQLQKLAIDRITSHDSEGVPLLRSGSEDQDFQRRIWEALVEKLGDGTLAHRDEIIAFLTYASECPHVVTLEDGKPDFDLLHKAWSCMEKLLEEGQMSGDHLGWCLSAIARLGYFPTNSLMTASAELLSAQLDGMPMSGAAACLRALASLRWYEPGGIWPFPSLVTPCASVVCSIAGPWVSQIPCSFLSPGVVHCGVPQELLDSYSSTLAARLREARLTGTHHISSLRTYGQILVGYGMFGHKASVCATLAEEMVDAVREHCMTKDPDHWSFCMYSVSNAVWSLAMMDMLDEPVVDDLSRLCEKLHASSTDKGNSNYTQLFHAMLVAQLQPGNHLRLSPEIEKAGFQGWQSMTSLTSQSFFQVFGLAPAMQI